MMKMMKYLQQNPAQETTSVDAVNCFVKLTHSCLFHSMRCLIML